MNTDSGTYKFSKSILNDNKPMDRIELTDFNLKAMSEDRLKGVYTATFGIIPSRTNINYVAILERELKFGRKLYEYQ